MKLIPSFSVWPPFKAARWVELEPDDDGRRVFREELVDVFDEPPPQQ